MSRILIKYLRTPIKYLQYTDQISPGHRSNICWTPIKDFQDNDQNNQDTDQLSKGHPSNTFGTHQISLRNLRNISRNPMKYLKKTCEIYRGKPIKYRNKTYDISQGKPSYKSRRCMIYVKETHNIYVKEIHHICQGNSSYM